MVRADIKMMNQQIGRKPNDGMYIHIPCQTCEND